MSTIKKKILHIAILFFFFTWGGIAAHYKIFPYNIIKFVKDNTYDKIYKPIQYFDGITRQATHNFSYYYNKYPNFIRKEPYITTYSKKTNIWLDRFYYNHENDDKLLNFYIVKNSRHAKKKIHINFLNDVEIYRAICKINDNSEYKNWEIADFTVAIIGGSCVHTKVVKKRFKKGKTILKSGGPTSSDPIFILGNIDIDKTKIN
jgi:hypothetical protein